MDHKVFISLSFAIICAAALVEKNPIRFLALFGLAVLIRGYWKSFHAWASNLGVDSFLEINTDIFNALAFISSIQRVFVFKSQSPLIGLPLIIITILVCSYTFIRFFKFNASLFGKRMMLVGIACLFATLAFVVWQLQKSYRSNSEIFSAVANNFGTTPTVGQKKPRHLMVVTYIGESTSVLNMGVYGYARNTTPKLLNLLEQDQNLLLFQNVFSPHTHTSPSLLEVLSVSAESNQLLKPIFDRKRFSLPRLLAKNNVDVKLFSNQGEAGSWNMAGSIIFAGQEKKFSMPGTGAVGNLEIQIPYVFDDEFLQPALQHTIALQDTGRVQAIFLHSVAGHSPYVPLINPQFSPSAKDKFDQLSSEAFSGRTLDTRKNVADYDAAIRYIDFNIAAAIEIIQKKQSPIIFVYFADHGEDSFSGKAHDSARFQHEMARVPFIIYFNPAAKLQYPDLFKKYAELAKNIDTKISTIFSRYILDFYGLDYDSQYENESDRLSPIVVREVASEIQFVDVNSQERSFSRYFENSNDAATSIYGWTQNLSKLGIASCYGDSNSFGAVERGRLVANCAATAIAIDHNENVFTADATGTKFGLPLGVFVELVSKQKRKAWVKINFDVTEKLCLKLQTELSKGEGVNAVVEFRISSLQHSQSTLHCAKVLSKNGVSVALGLTTHDMEKCSVAVNSACAEFIKTISEAKESGAISSLSVGQQDYKAAVLLQRQVDLKLSLSNVSVRSKLLLDPLSQNMIEWQSDDPNSL